MAYFNKTDYRLLIKLWRKTFNNTEDSLIQSELSRGDKWLMDNFLPVHFIDEMERK